jgi:hypothetical protein
MMTRTETLAEGVTLDERVALVPRRKPWGKTPIKAVVACRACDWTWKPTTGFGFERCPKCSKARSVRDRNYEGKKNIAGLKEHLKGKSPARGRMGAHLSTPGHCFWLGADGWSAFSCGCDEARLA